MGKTAVFFLRFCIVALIVVAAFFLNSHKALTISVGGIGIDPGSSVLGCAGEILESVKGKGKVVNYFGGKITRAETLNIGCIEYKYEKDGKNKKSAVISGGTIFGICKKNKSILGMSRGKVVVIAGCF